MSALRRAHPPHRRAHRRAQPVAHAEADGPGVALEMTDRADLEHHHCLHSTRSPPAAPHRPPGRSPEPRTSVRSNSRARSQDVDSSSAPSAVVLAGLRYLRVARVLCIQRTILLEMCHPFDAPFVLYLVHDDEGPSRKSRLPRAVNKRASGTDSRAPIGARLVPSLLDAPGPTGTRAPFTWRNGGRGGRREGTGVTGDDIRAAGPSAWMRSASWRRRVWP